MGGNVLHGTERPQAALGCYVGHDEDHAPRHGSGAVTYRDWLREHGARATHFGDLSPTRVQYMRKGMKGCGVILDARSNYDGSTDWFEVRENESGRKGWLPGTKVRLCSGDGRCRCERDANEAAGFRRACATVPAASVVPPGNTGTTLGVGA